MCADSNFSDFEVTARLNIGLILKFNKSNDFTIKKSRQLIQDFVNSKRSMSPFSLLNMYKQNRYFGDMVGLSPRT